MDRNNFCTLFNYKYLPQGLCLYESLLSVYDNFLLYILCVDNKVYEQLKKMGLEKVCLLKLDEYETQELIKAKAERTIAEYCWTLTPFLFSFVKKNTPDIKQLTYLDADLYFFNSPSILFDQLDEANKDILITEHGFAPEYEFYKDTSGRFCVQFLTVKYTPKAMTVIDEWQQQCLDWCYARYEDGKFGDQLYLDSWPEKYPATVHIFTQLSKTLAPWNIRYYSEKITGLNPVFFHFHNFRLIAKNRAQCYREYEIPGENYFYAEYLKAIQKQIDKMRIMNIPVPFFERKKEKMGWLKDLIRVHLKKNTGFYTFK